MLLFSFILLQSVYFVDCEMPIIMGDINNVTVPEGKECSFTCIVKNLGGYKVAWLRYDKKALLAIHDHVIASKGKIHVTHNDKDTWTLTIRHVNLQDAGFYMCQVNSKPMLSKVAFLNVVVPPYIDDNKSTKDISTVEGKNVHLKCSANGNPEPKIVWKYADTQRGHKLILRKGETLVIYNVTRYDMGYYMCIAKNGVPPARSKSIRVHVSFRPEVHIPNQVIGSPLRTNITLRCDVSAFPKPIMYWSDERGNIHVSNTKYIVEEIFHETFKASISMTILNVGKSDYQTYQCVAKNTMGENQELIKLYEIHRPYEESTSKPMITTTPEQEADQDTFFTTQMWTRPGHLPEQKQPSPHLSNSSHIIYEALANLKTALAVFLVRLLIL
ncbi:protein amalgam-like isoform X2 [Tigriopus californicus]|uniref:protein amalgam-like isoform X2 n=1 Tax=Tigriopus californicus TaxID=6832 RepID=UPI0027DA71B7|nr:protein amalgam-like isoform X2 [Tigriopus californicus]